MTETTPIPAGKETPLIKIPIFLGINNKEKLDQVIEILKDDDVYEIAIISSQKYRDLLMEYQYAKMSKEQQENVQKLLQSEEANANSHKLMLNLSEAGYKTVDRNELKLFFRMHRGRALTNKEADEILDVMYAMKKVELLNPDSKQHEYKFKLLITENDELEALSEKTSAIKEQIKTLSKETQKNELRMSELKEQIKMQEKDKNDTPADISGSQPDTQPNSNIQQ